MMSVLIGMTFGDLQASEYFWLYPLNEPGKVRFNTTYRYCERLVGDHLGNACTTH